MVNPDHDDMLNRMDSDEAFDARARSTERRAANEERPDTAAIAVLSKVWRATGAVQEADLIDILLGYVARLEAENAVLKAERGDCDESTTP